MDTSDPMGLQDSYGAQAAAQGLRQRIIDQLTQQKQAQDLDIQRQDLALRQQQGAALNAYHQQLAGSIADERAGASADKLLAPLSPGDVIDPSAMPTLTAGHRRAK